MATLLALQAWFRANPDTGAAVFGLAIFLLVYVVRKLLPSLWLRFEALSPALSAEMSAFDVVWHKAFQALPSAIAGLLAGPLFFGGDMKGALLGALNGLLAPIGHELLKNYKGRLGIGKPKDPGGPTGAKPVGLADGARDMTDVATPPEAPTAAMVGVAASPPRVGVVKVEIVVTSNQHPNRIAREVVKHLESLQRDPHPAG